ncbi:MAG: MBL fold metallo-hydrolase RNA specificity domain-containing protein [Thermoplasmata archaeon]
MQLGNGILVEVEGHKYRFDPKRVLPSETSMVSHAHSDHLPSSFRHDELVCSEITRDYLSLRCKKDARVVSDRRVTMIDAGHVPGSTMFLLCGETRVLYTGDFCTRDKVHTKGARPRKCDVLITEATYGKPHYVFPDYEEMMSAVRDWLGDIVGRGGSAVLLAYPLGKSQELAIALRDMPIAFHPSIAENNAVLARHGYDIPVRQLDPHLARRQPVVYVTSGYGRDFARVQVLRKRGAKVAAFSGWALDREFIRSSVADEAFPLSDHCGFDELMEFVRRCAPSKVFTTHGFAREFAMHVRSELGIDAQPLLSRQRTLDHFC